MKNTDNVTINIKQSLMLPAYVAMGLCLTVISLWWYLDEQRNINLHNALVDVANEHSSYIEADIRARLPALQRIANRWDSHGGTPKLEFIQDAAAYIKDLPGFQALEWVDKSFHVRWVTPLKGNENAVDLNLAAEKKRRIALELAKNKQVSTMSSPINLVQGGKGFLIYIPLFVDKNFDGFILAVFRIEQWLNYVFNLEAQNSSKKNYGISVSFDNEVVYIPQGRSDSLFEDWLVTSDINIMERSLSVSVVPTEPK